MSLLHITQHSTGTLITTSAAQLLCFVSLTLLNQGPILLGKIPLNLCSAKFEVVQHISHPKYFYLNNTLTRLNIQKF